MKSVIIAIVIFALVIGCAFFITFHFQSFTEKMLLKLDSLPNNMENLEKTEEKELREDVEDIAALWDEEFQRMVYLVGYSFWSIVPTAQLTQCILPYVPGIMKTSHQSTGSNGTHCDVCRNYNE